MRAVQYTKYGGPEVIEVKGIANPSAGSGQVLVEVHAASLNPFDWKLRSGYMKDMIPLQFPVTIGGDFSGVVVEVGKEVSEFKIGDDVFGQALVLNGGSGSIAQFCAANIKNTAAKPKSINHQESASLPLVGASAIQALEEHIKLTSGQKVLIHGGSGGIGSIAVQLAKYLGAYVATTVSIEKLQFAKKLGADEVIDYKNQRFEEMVKDFDAVFDTVGGETTEKSFKVLRRGGILVSMVGQPNEDLAAKYNVTAIGQNTQTNAERLSHLARLVDEGVIKPQVAKVFPLDETRQAFEHLESGHPRGKVVVSVKEG